MVYHGTYDTHNAEGRQTSATNLYGGHGGREHAKGLARYTCILQGRRFHITKERRSHFQSISERVAPTQLEMFGVYIGE